MITKTYNNLLTEYNTGNIAYSAIAIIGQSCIGSAAVMSLLMNENLADKIKLIELFFVTILCMGFNGTVLSQQSSKIQFNTLITSLSVSIALIILNLL